MRCTRARPGGRLVLVETNQNFIVPGVVVGTFTGYWAGISDGRVDAPFQSPDAWDSSLRKAGFSGLDVVLDDFPAPHNTTSVILSTYTPEEVKPPQSVAVQVLYSTETPPALVGQISKDLKQRGVIAKAGPLDKALDSVAAESCVVALFDVKHLLVNASEQYLKIFQHLARNAASLVALTSCGIVKGRNADDALIPGLLRVLQPENPVGQYMSIDIDADNFAVGNEEAEGLARCIVDQEFAFHEGIPTGDEEGSPKDREFSWQHGSMWVSRHVSAPGRSGRFTKGD